MASRLWSRRRCLGQRCNRLSLSSLTGHGVRIQGMLGADLSLTLTLRVRQYAQGLSRPCRRPGSAVSFTARQNFRLSSGPCPSGPMESALLPDISYYFGFSFEILWFSSAWPGLWGQRLDAHFSAHFIYTHDYIVFSGHIFSDAFMLRITMPSIVTLMGIRYGAPNISFSTLFRCCSFDIWFIDYDYIIFSRFLCSSYMISGR